MTTTLLKLPTAQRLLIKQDGPKSLETLLAQLPDEAQVKIHAAAVEVADHIPSMAARTVIVRRATEMLIEAALFGYHLGFEHGVYESREFPNKTPVIGG